MADDIIELVQSMLNVMHTALEEKDLTADKLRDVLKDVLTQTQDGINLAQYNCDQEQIYMHNEQEQLAWDQTHLAKNQEQFLEDRKQLAKDQEQVIEDQEQLMEDQAQLIEDQEQLTEDQAQLMRLHSSPAT